MLRYDLHCHSTYSDGLLSPSAIVHRAAARGVDVLALTDHDEVAGLAEANTAAQETTLRLVPGTELSASWRHVTLHVLGLNVDPQEPVLLAGLDAIRAGRTTRAKRIGEALAAAGIPDAYAGALKYVTSDRLVSRTHFARYLVEIGAAGEIKDVFRRYLAPGMPGYVSHAWATLSQAVEWIHAAGGQAVLAHPGRYKVTGNEMRELLGEFRALLGDGIEIVSSSHTQAQYSEYARYARLYGFVGSCGSDYHGPGESWMDLGDLPPFPAGVEPVWSRWQ